MSGTDFTRLSGSSDHGDPGVALPRSSFGPTKWFVGRFLAVVGIGSAMGLAVMYVLPNAPPMPGDQEVFLIPKLTQAATQACKKEYQLMPNGVAACPTGLEVVSQEQCQSAYTSIAGSYALTNTRGMQVGEWPAVPLDCSVQYDNKAYDQAPHWNTIATSSEGRVKNDEFRIICQKVEYQLMPNGVAACPTGLEIVSQEQCQSAYTSIACSYALTNTRGMQVGEWPAVPLDCSVQYDNPAYDQAPHWNTIATSSEGRVKNDEFRLICRKAGR